MFRFRNSAAAVILLAGLAAQPAQAAEQAQQCVAAAHELQETFDHSILKGWQLKFVARGDNCEVLHVESFTNLGKPSQEALAKGNMVYRKVLPGGVNKYAFSHGFSDVVYTNAHNAKTLSFGPKNLDRVQVKKLKRCTAPRKTG
ncbi:hypothetical protein GMLC_26330 [Geomonas limicola]|uniref:Uncharacterized protein n=1 Tax=Geomonas limicola TaxID=2740186 RepID=A0A6V8NB14_9BACT|nr:hypothetical protein [Geomonas limicola]GFO69054.1 hypothetical protein GMLC_26330 [Geomonas limicola]